MSRMDWDGAAKRDYVRGHGSVPYWHDLPKPQSLRTRPENTKTGKALATKARARCKPVVAEFLRLSTEERLAQADAYRERIRRLCADERAAVTPGRRRFAVGIEVAQKSLLAEIKAAEREAKGPPRKSPAPARKRGKAPQPLPKRTRGLGPVLAEGRPRRKVIELHPEAEVAELPQLNLEAVFRDGILYAAWDDHADADGWQLVVRGRDRQIRRVVTLAEDAIATQLELLPRDQAPYDLQVFARQGRRNVATARLNGIAFA